MSRNVQVIDQRIALALRGTETFRGVVDSSHGDIATVRTGSGLLRAMTAGHTVVAGSVVEMSRPRGVGGQIQIVRVLGSGTGLYAPPAPRTMLDVRDYGALCNGTTDDTQAWVAAIAYAASIGGADIHGIGSSRITSELWVYASAIRLFTGKRQYGVGPGSNQASGLVSSNPSYGADPITTGLIWGGSAGGTMVRFHPPFDYADGRVTRASVAPSGVGEGTSLSGCGFFGTLIGGPSPHTTVAAIGLKVTGVVGFEFECDGLEFSQTLVDLQAGAQLVDNRYYSTVNREVVCYGIGYRGVINPSSGLRFSGWSGTKTLAIASATTGTPGRITTVAPHYLMPGLSITFTGTDTTPTLNTGTYVVGTIIDGHTFELLQSDGVTPKAITGAGTGAGSFVATYVNAPDSYNVAFYGQVNVTTSANGAVGIDIGYCDHIDFWARVNVVSLFAIGTSKGILFRDGTTAPFFVRFHGPTSGGPGGIWTGETGGPAYPSGIEISYDPDVEGVPETIAIVSASVANPTLITLATDHSRVSGESVTITGSNSTPSIDGTRVITFVSRTSFTVPVNVTVAGTSAGTVRVGTFFHPVEPHIGAHAGVYWRDPRRHLDETVGYDLPADPSVAMPEEGFIDYKRRHWHTSHRRPYSFDRAAGWESDESFTDTFVVDAATATATFYRPVPYLLTNIAARARKIDLVYMVAGATAISGTDYWAFDFHYGVEPGNAGGNFTAITTVFIPNGAALNAWHGQSKDVNVYMGYGAVLLRLVATKVGTPGALSVLARVHCRLQASRGYIGS